MINNELKYGRIASITGVILTLLPYNHNIGIVALIAGAVLITISKSSVLTKTFWIGISVLTLIRIIVLQY